MGIGYCMPPPASAKEWNSGCCDVMAVALHRMYGLPMMAEFEYGKEGRRTVLGFLVHAWVKLPDGRALDAAGPRPMFESIEGGDDRDPWVEGYRIVHISDRDRHLLDIREETNYVDAIRDMRVPQWIWENLGPSLSGLGLEPLRYRNLVGLPPRERKASASPEASLHALARALPAGSKFDFAIYDGELHLKSFKIPAAARGVGTAFLARVVAVADEFGLRSRLEADPTDEPGDPDTFDLVRWYSRFGFGFSEIDDNDWVVMRRAPRPFEGVRGVERAYSDAKAMDVTREWFEGERDRLADLKEGTAAPRP